MNHRRALTDLLASIHIDAELTSWHQTAWTSATFSGVRFCAMLCFPGAAAGPGEAWLYTIGGGEFTIPRCEVIDAQCLWLEWDRGPDGSRGLRCEIAGVLLDAAPRLREAA